MSGLHEECGVFGVFAERPTDAAKIAYYGLYALQHRGQESCGIVVNDDGLFVSHKDLGTVAEVFTKETLASFPRGTMAVGHTRYGTTGGTNRQNCQPIEVNHVKGRMAIAHNGNLSNAAELRSELELSGAIFHTSSDTETIAYLVTRERLSAPSIEDALIRAMGTLDGAYSLVLMSPAKLICARDPYGFRPLCSGKTPDGAYIVASESCALAAVGACFIRDVMPGEVLIFSRDGVTSRRERCGTKPKKLCVFEYIYFARPDSVIDGRSVHAARIDAGRILSETHPVAADLVIGVPDSGLDAALGYSRASGIPYDIGLIKNKYIGRTFRPGEHQTLRRRGGRARQTDRSDRRFDRPGNDLGADRVAAPTRRGARDPFPGFGAAVPVSLLLRHRRRFAREPDRRQPYPRRDCPPDRRRFARVLSDRAAERTCRRPPLLPRVLRREISDENAGRHAQKPF